MLLFLVCSIGSKTNFISETFFSTWEEKQTKKLFFLKIALNPWNLQSCDTSSEHQKGPSGL